MDLNDDDFARLARFMDKEREKYRNIHGRRLRQEAGQRITGLGELIDSVTLVPGGKAEALDAPFDAFNIFLPSMFIRTQLRLACHYTQAADAGIPTLSSFVVLRAAIECIATAHWLMSGRSHRAGVERVLKRMWWDTLSAADLAETADDDTDPSAKAGVQDLIRKVGDPIKGIDAERIASAPRIRLSRMIQDASRELRPDDPAEMQAAWMVCAAVSHGNIPVSAGAGLSAALIQHPDQHPIDAAVFAQLLWVTVDALAVAASMFETVAAERLVHQPAT